MAASSTGRPARFPPPLRGSLTAMAEDRRRNPDDEHLPGNVSDQNREEQLPEHEGQTETRRRGDGGSGGESSEGSQSTGSPGSAG